MGLSALESEDNKHAARLKITLPCQPKREFETREKHSIRPPQILSAYGCSKVSRGTLPLRVVSTVWYVPADLPPAA